jgi:hypothetical protein
MATEELTTAGAARTAAADTVQSALDALTVALIAWRDHTAAMGTAASAAGIDQGAASALAQTMPAWRALLWHLHAVCPAPFEAALDAFHGARPDTFAATDAARVVGFLNQY